ncbi:MAG: hypothetical protein KAT34_06435 [Candidatus Aminicenantes bacterium]|nr:hypothetical protein [Candidatus Aminicenantes bacterium]
MIEAIITAIAVIIGATIQAKVGLPFSFWRKSNHKVFDMPKDKPFNIDFYKYFIKKIKAAKKSIYITGDGLNMIFSDDEGKGIANKYFEAFKHALINKVSIVRIQFGNDFHPDWEKMIKELIKNYPDLFHFYIMKEKNDTQIVSLCAVDPHLKNGNVVEIMLPIEGTLGPEKKKLAGPVIFFNNCQEYAHNITNEIIRITKRGDCIEYIDSVEKLERISKN